MIEHPYYQCVNKGNQFMNENRVGWAKATDTWQLLFYLIAKTMEEGDPNDDENWSDYVEAWMKLGEMRPIYRKIAMEMEENWALSERIFTDFIGSVCELMANGPLTVDGNVHYN